MNSVDATKQLEGNEICKTPSRKSIMKSNDLPKTPVMKCLENVSTPRRSVRKSIKPAQDYEEIILKKRVLRPRNSELENSNIEEHKWSPSKVGRSSQKRSVRKGRSGRKSKASKKSDDDIQSSEESEGKRDDAKNVTHPTVTEVSEEVLNATFDKECDEIGNENKEENLIVIEESKHVCISVDNEKELKDSIVSDDVDHKDSEVVPPILKFIKEGNDLGCTPILYDDSNDVEKEDSDLSENKEDKVLHAITTLNNEIFVEIKNHSVNDNNDEEKEKSEENGTAGDKDTGCIGLSNNETFEKNEIELANIGVISANVEVPKGDDETEKDISESPEKLSEENEMKNIDSDTGNSTIDLISDDDMPSLMLSDDEAINSEKKDDEAPLNDTFNTSDCEIISAEIPSVTETQQTEKEKETQKNEKVNLLAEAERRVKELQTNYFSPTQKLKKTIPTIVVTKDKKITENLAVTSPLVTKSQNIEKSIKGGKYQNVGTPVALRKRQMNDTPSSMRKRQNIETPSKLPIARTPSKRPIVGTSSSINKYPFGETPNKRQIGVTPIKPQITGTPVLNTKQKSKGYRFPTPYKSKKDFRFGDETDIDKENENEYTQESPVIPIITTMEPKEIILRSIRKRSLSVTIDGDQRKRRALNVTFYSPANQTANIADLDKMLAKNASKRENQQHKNVTRRKRSISLDDNYLRSEPSKLPKPVFPIIPAQKTRATARTRLPNFAAIHQQQFEKMENLVDYVARKAERAQHLSNSASKNCISVTRSPATNKQKPNASKSLILTPSNKDNVCKSSIPLSSNKDSTQSASDKLHKRTQRHIDLFKSRPVDSERPTKRHADIIRGVRSNRRFELMMKHRKTSGN